VGLRLGEFLNRFGNAPDRRSALHSGLPFLHAAGSKVRPRMLNFAMPAKAPTRFNFTRDVVERWAQERPDALALWYVGEQESVEHKLTFGQLAGQSRRAASSFDQLGLRRGDRVLVVTPRVPRWWIAMLGLIRLGAVPIPGTPMLTAKDIQYRLGVAEAAALITDAEGAAKAKGLNVAHRIIVEGNSAGWISFEEALRQADQ